MTEPKATAGDAVPCLSSLGFTTSQLLSPYHEWIEHASSLEHRLRSETKQWLYEWRMWDLACSPMSDEDRKRIRYGHYLGWHAAMKPNTTVQRRETAEEKA